MIPTLERLQVGHSLMKKKFVRFAELRRFL